MSDAIRYCRLLPAYARVVIRQEERTEVMTCEKDVNLTFLVFSFHHRIYVRHNISAGLFFIRGCEIELCSTYLHYSRVG
jgi:hypothetical protein